MINANGRRSNIEVIADILRMGEASRTHIMYRVGMSYAQLEKYLDYLVERSFLAWTRDRYPGGIYHITEEGKLLLESIEKIEELLYRDDEAASTDNISQSMAGSGSRATKVFQRRPVSSTTE